MKKPGIFKKLLLALAAIAGRFYSNGKFSASTENSVVPTGSEPAPTNIVVSEAAHDHRLMDEAHDENGFHSEKAIAEKEALFQAHMATVEAEKARRLAERAVFDAENNVTPYTRARNKLRAWEWMRAEVEKQGPTAVRYWEKANPRPDLLLIDNKHLVSGGGIRAKFDDSEPRNKTHGVYKISSTP